MRWTKDGFEVALIPHTVSHTAFAQTAVGDAVNLEIDLVARYVERLLGTELQRERPHEFRPIPELLEEIRNGRMVVIVDDEDRENEGDLIMAAEMVKPSDINFMVTHARGLVCLSLTRERCRQLGLPPMVRDNTSQHGTNFTVSIEAAEGVTTGISAYDRAHTIRTAVRPDAKPQDLSQPGHIFPLTSQPGGVLNRAGHTEAASDLALLAGLEPAGVLVEILNADGSMARRPQLEDIRARARPEDRFDRGAYPLPPDHRAHHRARRRARDRNRARPLPTAHLSRPPQPRPALRAAARRGRRRRSPPWSACTCRTRWPMRCIGAARDFGPGGRRSAGGDRGEGRGALVLLGESSTAESMLARIRADNRHEPQPRRARRRLAEWRRNGAGAQILADLGLGKLRVLGTPRRQVGLAGFGLDVVEYVRTDALLDSASPLKGGYGGFAFDLAFKATANAVPAFPGMTRRGNPVRGCLTMLNCASQIPAPPCPIYEGELRAPEGARFAIIASRWNPRITDALVAGARKSLRRATAWPRPRSM